MGMAAAVAESQFHVLAVDDSLVDRKVIERLLKTSSYQVTTVDSGSKALEFLGLVREDEEPNSPSVSVEINLVITDYCMPGMTGYDLLKKIKESSSLRNMPVVIMSSENVPSRIDRCLEEGADEFFLKPVRLSDLKKLKPHLMKTKIQDENKQLPHQREEEESESDTSNFQSPSSKLQHSHSQQQQSQQQSNNNKRKSVEEGLSPERRRSRYNGIASVA